MRRTALLALAAAALMASDAAAQTKVINLAGTWVVVDSASLGRGGRGGLGATVTVIQEPTILTIVRTTPTGQVRSVYKLDGSDSKNTVIMGTNSIETTSRSMWKTDTLMISTSRLVNGATVETVMNLWIDPSGNLVVASSGPGRGGGPVVTTTVVYKKGG
jgi:hypothetical protein